MLRNCASKLCKDAQEDRPTYRAYLIGANNHIFAAHVIEARSDDEAAAAARAIAGTSRVEVWERGRRILKLKPDLPSHSGAL